MTVPPRLTPAQWRDLQFDDRCQYVPHGRHALVLNRSTGHVTCDNRGCDLSATHPHHQTPRPRRSVAQDPAPRERESVRPFVYSFVTVASVVYAHSRGWM